MAKGSSPRSPLANRDEREHLPEQVGGEVRRDICVVERGAHLDDVSPAHVETGEPTHQAQGLARGQPAGHRGSGAGCERGIDSVDIERDVHGARAVQRRLRTPAATDRLRYGSFSLDLREHVLWVDSQSITLTAIELAVMRELLKARGRPLSRVDLLDLAWDASDLETTERAVDNVILRLRRKLPRPDALETVRGVGFRLAPN